MRFAFLHAADLHIDSPLAGLCGKNDAVAARFAEAGRRAVAALIDEAIAAQAAFLAISGDIFDGDWRDVSTGLFFVRELARLERENIPVYLVRGNHDFDSPLAKSLPYPANVRVFASRQAQSFEIDRLRVALHGRSFNARLVDGGFVASYPPRREGWFNVGLLHTALDGSRGHASYAPCSVEDLKRFGYDYWALGHVHAAERVCADPHIVYPGNLQGRSVREDGPKGAMRVVVSDGRVESIQHVALDVARWVDARLDISRCEDEADALTAIESRLRQEHAKAEGRALALRLTLEGATPAHERLVARRESLEADARAIACRFGEDFWVERLKIETRAPQAREAALATADALDVEALIGEAADADFAFATAALIDEVAAELPPALRDEFRREANAAALAVEARDLLLGEIALRTGGA
ncbi:MAG TPA: DNA repair exonuclease [Methylocystis sp.]|nr:DNA repair exonuclease [Methylocystis sp.]